MHRNFVYPFLSLSALTLMLGGCLAQSQIQAKYMSREAECREEAQNRVANSPQTGMSALGYDSRIETAYTLSSGFSDCMNKQGWKVAVPKPPAQPAGNVAVVTPPPSGAPGPGGTVARTPATNAAPAAAPILGPGVQPAPATAYPAARPVPVQGTAPATGYPNPAYNTYIPEYGTGAGRQF
jgi:hypothetical protein